MLIRISLIVAIIAALAAGVLDFTVVKTKVTTLISERDEWHGKFTETDSKLKVTKADLDKTKTDLAETKKTLDTTKTERDKAVAEADTQVKRAAQLADDLSKAKKDRDEAQADLGAYKNTGFTAEQVMSMGKTLNQTKDALGGSQEENKVLGKRIANLEYELDKYRGKIKIVYLPANLTGKILVSDPKWDFVVLNVGEQQGILKDGELLVNRDGKLVAKVIVRSIQKDRCIANVVPGWKLGEVLEGDQVIPAHPASS